MQVRAGNRQDEPLVRAIVSQYLEEQGRLLDLEGADKDLRNLEHNYVWYDGLFIVAEREGQLVGFAAGRRANDNSFDQENETPAQERLVLSRLIVTPGARRRGAGKALVKVLSFFAQNMGYKEIALDKPAGLMQPESFLAMQKLGFRPPEDLNTPMTRLVEAAGPVSRR